MGEAVKLSHLNNSRGRLGPGSDECPDMYQYRGVIESICSVPKEWHRDTLQASDYDSCGSPEYSVHQHNPEGPIEPSFVPGEHSTIKDQYACLYE